MKNSPKGLKEVADFPDGSIALECPFCNGTGVFPETEFDDPGCIETEKCPVCNGSAVNIFPGESEVFILCKYCKASGRAWNEDGHFVGDPCGICGGRGFLDLSSLKSKLNVHNLGDFWSLIYPEIVSVSKKRFEAGQFSDAVEAAFKHFNSVVKGLASLRGKVIKDGASLMNYVFSANKPIIELSDLTTETGRNIQQGYMQMFAGGMIGIRNPKAHEILNITPTRAIHFLFVASLFFFKLDERNNILFG